MAGVEGVAHQLEDHRVAGKVAVADGVKGAVPLDVLIGNAGLGDERGTDGGDDGFVEGPDDRVADACLGDGAVVELADDSGTGFLVGAGLAGVADQAASAACRISWTTRQTSCRRAAISPGGDTPEADTHLTYMINIVLTAEFAIEVGGAR